MWMWILLAVFASDNILGYMMNPFLFYPLCVLGSIFFAIWQLDLLPVVIEHGIPDLKRRINGLLAKTPIDVRI